MEDATKTRLKYGFYTIVVLGALLTGGVLFGDQFVTLAGAVIKGMFLT